MTEEELKNKCKERAKIFQQAMESCRSSSPMDCIEWFADRIAELEKSCDETQELLDKQIEATYKLDKENAELRHQLNKNPCVAKTEWHCSDCLDQLTTAKEIIKILLHKLIMAKAPYKTDLTENEIAEIKKLIGDSEVEE